MSPFLAGMAIGLFILAVLSENIIAIVCILLAFIIISVLWLMEELREDKDND